MKSLSAMGVFIARTGLKNQGFIGLYNEFDPSFLNDITHINPHIPAHTLHILQFTRTYPAHTRTYPHIPPHIPPRTYLHIPPAHTLLHIPSFSTSVLNLRVLGTSNGDSMQRYRAYLRGRGNALYRASQPHDLDPQAPISMGGKCSGTRTPRGIRAGLKWPTRGQLKAN